MADKKSYPYLPEKCWWILRDQFKKTLPKQVTKPYLRSLLSLGSERSAENYVRALRVLGLIDEANAPTSRANEWRDDSKYQDVIQQMVVEVYPDELRDLFSGSDLDRAAVKDWMKHNNALGDVAAGQAASFYALLNQPVPQDATDFRAKANTAAPKAAPRKQKPAGETPRPPAGDQPTQQELKPPKRSGAPTVHVDLQVHISPDATAEQIDDIFASMAKHLFSGD